MTQKLLKPCIIFLMLLFFWELICREYSNLLFVLPAPSAILERVWMSIDRFWYNTQVTLKEMVGGLLLALIVAFPLAWLMLLWDTARHVLQPIFVLIQCIPMFALAPIMVIWFDWSYTAILVPTALMIFFPLTINIYQGLLSTPQALVDYFRINQASEWQTLYKLRLPWALPMICSGLKISAAVAGIGAIAGEWAGAQAGLGMMMLESRRGADLEGTFGALLCLTLVSLSFYGCALLLERCLMRRGSVRGTGVLVAASMIGLLCVSCEHTESLTTRLILDWLPNPNHVAIYVGIEKQFFLHQGIDLRIQKVHDPGDVLPYLTSGQAELAISYMPHTMRAIRKGAQVVAIAPLIGQPLNGLIFRDEGDIKAPVDLNDKCIGYCVDGSQTRFLNVLLEMNHITPRDKKNVSFDLVGTLGTKKVDAIYGGYWNVEAEHLRSYGIPVQYFTLSQLGVPEYYELLILARKESQQTENSFIEAFQRGLALCIAYCKDHPEEAFNIYASMNPDKSKKTLDWEYKSWLLTVPLLSKDQQIDAGIWDRFDAWLENNKLY